MSDEEIDAIAARAEAATKGPWERNPGYSGIRRVNQAGQRRLITDHDGDMVYEDEVFIAAARTDVPALVAALREARKVLREAHAALERAAGRYDAAGSGIAAQWLQSGGREKVAAVLGVKP